MTQRERKWVRKYVRPTLTCTRAVFLSRALTHAQGNSIRGELLSPLDQATPSRQEEEALLLIFNFEKKIIDQKWLPKKQR